RSIAKVRPITERTAGTLIDAVRDRSEMDLVSEFAYDLPIMVITQLLGVPEGDFPVIRGIASDFVRGSELSPVETDRTRRADAADELLRYDTPNQINNRLLLDDARFGDVRIPAGDHVGVLIGAANRDPAQFPEPDRLQLARPVPQSVAFAFGAYHCVGKALA